MPNAGDGSSRLLPGVQFAVIGDLMVEYMLYDAPADSTRVLDPRDLALGGPAFNVAWHLAHLRRSALLVGCLGDRETELLQPFKDAGVDLSGVVRQPGASDQLVAFVTKGIHRSVYIRAPVSDEIYESMIDACYSAECIVLNGSRHPYLRRRFAELMASTTALVVSNPSYAVFTYERYELENLIKQSKLTILNEPETKFVCAQLDARNARRTVTKIRPVHCDDFRGPAVRLYIGRAARLPCHRSLVSKVT